MMLHPYLASLKARDWKSKEIVTSLYQIEEISKNDLKNKLQSPQVNLDKSAISFYQIEEGCKYRFVLLSYSNHNQQPDNNDDHNHHSDQQSYISSPAGSPPLSSLWPALDDSLRPALDDDELHLKKIELKAFNLLADTDIGATDPFLDDVVHFINIVVDGGDGIEDVLGKRELRERRLRAQIKSQEPMGDVIPNYCETLTYRIMVDMSSVERGNTAIKLIFKKVGYILEQA
ncbi:hypothetical protein RHGRI_032396 [Rhododendron griersonianum]|uniref:Uncharacterized protein n=1 Tax=Rhododendron griersonianum TaxID=479676 RepID=A0AAV6IC63_9ERIC|nr:hypothetical protein RHGRI_032396 [Rhododendron griersonianum]